MIEYSRHFSMPSHNTFTLNPIKKLLDKYKVGKGWIDPFAGDYSMAEITNDHNPEKPTLFHLEAVDFIESQKNNKFIGALFDPPYSYRQVSEHYKVIGKKATQLDTSSRFYSRVLEPLSQIIAKDGLCISFGWNTNGVGKKRGFEIIEIMIISHGGYHNDTLVTVEKKL